MSAELSSVAIFFDIEGTLTHEGRLISGAVEVLRMVRDGGANIRFLTNITAKMPQTIAEDLRTCGLSANDDEIFTAASACATYARLRNLETVRLIISEEISPLFVGLKEDKHNPSAIIIGDVAEQFDFNLLDDLFRQIDEGSELIAMSRNLFWFNKGRKQLDAGTFVSALELATGREAIVCGKPSDVIFSMAVKSLENPRCRILVVGDDIKTDIAGANQAGLEAVLVGTGKFQHQDRLSVPYADFLPTVADLPGLLTKKLML